MKKLAVTAATLAVLIGGVSSLFAQVIPDMPYKMQMDATQRSQGTIGIIQIKRRAFISNLLHNSTQTNLSYEKVFRTEGTYNFSSPSVGGNFSVGNGKYTYHHKPYPTEGGTFDGRIYTGEKAHYMIVSSQTWDSLNDACGRGWTYKQNVKGENGEVLFSGNPSIDKYQLDEETYVVVSFPFPEEKDAPANPEK